MTIEQAIEAEAQAQAICMLTEDFARAYHAFVAKQQAGLRRQLRAGDESAEPPRLALLRAAPRAISRATLDAWAVQHRVAAAWRRCRRRMPRAGARAGRRRLAARTRCRRPMAARRAHRHARDLPDPRDAGAPLGPGRLRLRDAGPGLGRDQPGRHAGRRSSATCRAWRAARRSRPSRCPNPRPAPTSRRWHAPRASTATTPCSTARRPGSRNGGIADFYVVFARSGEAPGARGISAFIVDADTPGFEIAERIDVIAPHPLARLRFTNCRVPLTPAHRRRRRRLQGRDAHARRLPHLGGRRRARLRAPRAATKALQRATTPQDVRRARWPTSS